MKRVGLLFIDETGLISYTISDNIFDVFKTAIIVSLDEWIH